MPRVSAADSSFDPIVFGKNVRNLRQVRGWSIKSLAKRAGVASHTVHRVEMAFPSTKSVRTRIANALDTLVERLGRTSDPIRHDVALPDPGDDRWLGLIDSRPMVPEDNDTAIQSPEERDRLGRLGFVTQFVKILKCRLPKGKLVAGILELYDVLPPSTYLGGEIFAFALKGDSYLNHNDETFLMKEGSASTFDCTKPFYFSPAEPISKAGCPTLVLYVRLEETEPIDMRPRRRGPTVEGQFQNWVDPEGKIPDATSSKRRRRPAKPP